MGMKVKFNPVQLEASIRNEAERAARGASESMRRSAIRIRDLARDYAPIKTGALEKAIDYMTLRDPVSRRNVFVVYVDLDQAAGLNKQVGDYAFIMEQYLHPYGRGIPPGFKREINLGLRSRVKRDGGKKVGGRFLSRAVRDGSKEILKDAKVAVSKALNGRLVNVQYQRDTGDEE